MIIDRTGMLIRQDNRGPTRDICLVASDQQLVGAARQALAAINAGSVRVIAGPVGDHIERLKAQPPALTIVELRAPYQLDLAALERLQRHTTRHAFPVVVIADGLSELETRQLFRLGVIDWLTREAVASELADAAGRALGHANQEQVASHASIFAMMPAFGGAGASTLSIAAMEVLSRARKAAASSCCLVDLDFARGSIADYLDIEPGLDLREIAAAPERLDAQLLDVMLSQCRDGFAVLAARPSLTIDPKIDEQLIGRLLDLVAGKFAHVVIDLPPVWEPWSEAIIRGADRFHIVTTLSVAGLRQARRMVEDVTQRTGLPLSRTVLVNKVHWISNQGLGKPHAHQMLGQHLAGFISDGGVHARMAQNHGKLLSSVRSRSSIVSCLRTILFDAA